VERRIGTTDLRQRLTDVLEAVREIGRRRLSRPLAVLQQPSSTWTTTSNSSGCRRNARFFESLETTATRNAERNAGLSDQQMLAIIEKAREEAAQAGG